MLYTSRPITFTVVQVGNLDRAELTNALGTANMVQRAFYFDLLPERILLDNMYKLPNSSYNLDLAIENIIQNHHLSGPMIFMTSAPYGVPEQGDDPNGLYWSSDGLEYAPQTSIVSTYLWDRLPNKPQLQSYFLLNLASAAFSVRDLIGGSHVIARGCINDYCNQPSEFLLVFDKGIGLCDECNKQLHERPNQIAPDQIASAVKLIYVALGQKTCFMVMPFKEALTPVYKMISRRIKKEGWKIERGDEIKYPKQITEAIFETILKSDLVIADMTEFNANVFYEIGMAHSLGINTILISQPQPIPFDLKDHRVIFYEQSKKGLDKLAKELKESVGPGTIDIW
jgi:hypothetical protein